MQILFFPLPPPFYHNSPETSTLYLKSKAYRKCREHGFLPLNSSTIPKASPPPLSPPPPLYTPLKKKRKISETTVFLSFLIGSGRKPEREKPEKDQEKGIGNRLDMAVVSEMFRGAGRKPENTGKWQENRLG